MSRQYQIAAGSAADDAKIAIVDPRLRWNLAAWAAIDPSFAPSSNAEFPYRNGVRSGIRVFHNGTLTDTVQIARAESSPNPFLGINTTQWAAEGEHFIDMNYTIPGRAAEQPTTPMMSNWSSGATVNSPDNGHMSFQWMSRDGVSLASPTDATDAIFMIRIWRFIAFPLV